MRTFVTIKTSFEGLHCFPAAPKEVEYLKHEHRHMFGVNIIVEVFSDDREIEFIMMKHRINDWLYNQQDENGVWHMGTTSCEQVATKLLNVLSENYQMDGRQYQISVDEDGENGAIIEGEFSDVTTDEEHSIPLPAEPGVKTFAMLTLDDYQKRAYNAIQQHTSSKEEIMHWAIGLGEEAGETLSVIKHKYYGGKFDVMDFVSEIGDTLWHVAALCTVFGITLNDAAWFNLNKLDHRYPDGQFSATRSEERQTIEGDFKESTTYKQFKTKIENDLHLRRETDEEF